MADTDPKSKTKVPVNPWGSSTAHLRSTSQLMNSLAPVDTSIITAKNKIDGLEKKSQKDKNTLDVTKTLDLVAQSNQSVPMNTMDNTKNKDRVRGVVGVVNVKKQELMKKGYDDFAHWSQDPGNLYIGRDMSFYVPGATKSVWGNPFPVAKPGKDNSRTSRQTYTLDESLQKFREHIESNPELIERLKELDGKVLGCWCKPNRCHGDVLTELVEKYCNK